MNERLAHFILGQEVWFWPIYGSEKAKVKIVGINGETYSVEFLESFQNSRINRREIGEVHPASQAHLTLIK